MTVWYSDFFAPRNRPWNSGLTLLLSHFDGGTPLRPGEPIDFLRLVHSNAWTEERFKHAKSIRVCEALALHHYLDPDVLGLSRGAPYKVLEKLSTVLRSLTGNQVEVFEGEFPTAIAAVLQGEVPCITKDHIDPLQSTTTFADFQRYLEKNGMARQPPRDWVRFDQLTLPFAHSTQLLSILSELSLAWTPKNLGGVYEPGNRSTEPDIRALALARAPDSPHMSEKVADVMKKMLHPETVQREGRRAAQRGDEPK